MLFENVVILQVDTELGEKSYIGALLAQRKQIWKTPKIEQPLHPILVQDPRRVELIASGAESNAYDPTMEKNWRADGLVSHAPDLPRLRPGFCLRRQS